MVFLLWTPAPFGYTYVCIFSFEDDASQTHPCSLLLIQSLPRGSYFHLQSHSKLSVIDRSLIYGFFLQDTIQPVTCYKYILGLKPWLKLKGSRVFFQVIGESLEGSNKALSCAALRFNRDISPRSHFVSIEESECWFNKTVPLLTSAPMGAWEWEQIG